jgi:methyl-accepting chemotaxis protein
MSRSASEVNGRADDLAALAEKLRELISRFKV